MSILGGEKMSRLAVGIFALILTGGLAVFFTGSLDSFIGTKEKVVNKPPMPFAKPKQAVSSKTLAANTATTAPVAPANILDPTPAQVVVAPAPPLATQTPVVAATTPPAKAEPSITARAEETTINAAFPKPPSAKSARKHDMDLRNCLELTDNLAIAQCAYKTP